MGQIGPSQNAQYAMTPQVTQLAGEFAAVVIEVAAGKEIVLRSAYPGGTLTVVTVEVLSFNPINTSQGSITPQTVFAPAGYALASPITKGTVSTAPIADGWRLPAVAAFPNTVPAQGLFVRAGQFLVFHANSQNTALSTLSIVFEEQSVVPET